MSNQGCRVRSAIMNINSNEPLFYPYTVLLNKCSDNPQAKLCAPDIVKDRNIRVSN